MEEKDRNLLRVCGRGRGLRRIICRLGTWLVEPSIGLGFNILWRGLRHSDVESDFTAPLPSRRISFRENHCFRVAGGQQHTIVLSVATGALQPRPLPDLLPLFRACPSRIAVSAKTHNLTSRYDLVLMTTSCLKKSWSWRRNKPQIANNDSLVKAQGCYRRRSDRVACQGLVANPMPKLTSRFVRFAKTLDVMLHPHLICDQRRIIGRISLQSLLIDSIGQFLPSDIDTCKRVAPQRMRFDLWSMKKFEALQLARQIGLDGFDTWLS